MSRTSDFHLKDERRFSSHRIFCSSVRYILWPPTQSFLSSANSTENLSGGSGVLAKKPGLAKEAVPSELSLQDASGCFRGSEMPYSNITQPWEMLSPLPFKSATFTNRCRFLNFKSRLYPVNQLCGPYVH
jgi:hypothetical protein